jgi:hypothetical protein
MSKLQTPPPKYQSGFLEQLDKRTAIAQDLQSRFDSYAADLGGVDRLSYAQRSLLEHCLFLQYWLHSQEQALATGAGEFDSGRYSQALNSLQGIFSKLGMSRVAREISLQDVMSRSKSGANS